MAYKHLLVQVDTSRRAPERIGLALALAARAGARLTGLFAEAESLGASLVGRRSPETMARAAAEARVAFEGRAHDAGVATSWWSLEPSESDPLVGRIGICCRYADLAILGQHDPGDARLPEDALGHVLFHAGRPVLAVPSAGRFPGALRCAVVGWNGSREAARALSDALPLLEGAERVHVVALQRPGRGPAPGPLPALDVAAHLGDHGIKATSERAIVDSDELDASDILLNRSFDLQADLLVVGAYAHAGLSGPRPAASTKKLLEAMTVPVLFSH